MPNDDTCDHTPTTADRPSNPGETIDHGSCEPDPSALDPAGLVLADQRRRWRDGDRVPLESYLAARPELAADSSVLLDLVYGEYLLAEEVGAAPQPAAYADRFPAVGGKLIDQIELHRALVAAGATAPVGVGGVTPHDAPAAPGYELLGELGRGGMGVVYKARQPRLNRVVALKTLSNPDGEDSAAAIRFLAEAEAVAAVRHPHVVQVYEYGQHDGRPYFAMEFLAGGSLRDRLKGGRPLPPAETAALVAKVGRGVQAAHDQQIVHRDLKPGNVLFDADGEPKVADFGLARRGAGSGLTQTQALMGTPAYMAPEQARGDAKFVGPSADVYALGVVLYECLTGTVPFPGDNPLVVMRRVAQEEPESPRRRNPAVPRDLELVCLKCLEKDPRGRYPSAAALADDLDRFLQGVPITARPVGTWERGWKWVRRHPAATAVGVASTVAVLSLVAFLVSRSYQGELEEANTRERAARAEADRLRGIAEDSQRQTDEALKRVERVRYSSLLALAAREVAANDLGRAEALLNDCPPTLRGWEWSYLMARAHVPRTVGRKHTGQVLALAYSPDGERLAAGARDGSVRVRDENLAREKVVVIRGHKGPVRGVAFDPDGVSLATAGDDATVRVWELTNQKLGFRPENGPLFRARSAFRHPGPVLAVAYSPDGRRLAWVGEDGAVKVWDVGGKEPREVGRHDGPAHAIAFRPDGRQLASAGEDRTVRVWDPTGGLLFALGPHAGPVSGVAWRADGEHLAAAVDEPGQPGELVVWDAATRQKVRTLLGPPGGVLGVAYDPDGRLAATGRDGTLRVWAAGGEPGPVLRGTTTLAAAPAVRPGGKFLAVGGGDPDGKGEVTIWELSGRPDDRTLPGHPGGATGLDFTPGGERLATGGRDGLVRLWDVSTGRPVHTFPGHEGAVNAVAASPDLLAVASAGRDGTVRLWDVPTGKALPVLKRHTGPVSAVAFAPDGAWLVSAAGEAIVWDANTGRPRFPLPGHTGPVTAVTVSADGRRLATGGADRTVRVWDAADGRELQTCLGHTAGVTSVAFSPDGTRLASGGLDRTVRVWDPASGQVVHVLRGHGAEVRGVAFAPDGTRLGSAGADGTVRLWDPETGLELFTLPAHPRGATGVAFAAGGRIAAATAGGSVKVWEAAPWAGRSSEFDHDD